MESGGDVCLIPELIATLHVPTVGYVDKEAQADAWRQGQGRAGWVRVRAGSQAFRQVRYSGIRTVTDYNSGILRGDMSTGDTGQWTGAGGIWSVR